VIVICQDRLGTHKREERFVFENGRRFLAGFGGGNDISENLLFETCGESGDHGAINSWDRQAFITSVATGQPSFIPAVTHIHHNFIVADGNADGGAVDNDDGSSHYSIHHNFAIYGGAKINNIGGHSQVSEQNRNGAKRRETAGSDSKHG
jgi:hypothetical protein